MSMPVVLSPVNNHSLVLKTVALKDQDLKNLHFVTHKTQLPKHFSPLVAYYQLKAT